MGYIAPTGPNAQNRFFQKVFTNKSDTVSEADAADDNGDDVAAADDDDDDDGADDDDDDDDDECFTQASERETETGTHLTWTVSSLLRTSLRQSRNRNRHTHHMDIQHSTG